MEERCAARKADVENSPDLCTEQSKELPFFNCFTGNYSARMLDSAWAVFYDITSFSSESRQSSPGAWTPRLKIFMLMRSLSFLLEAVFLNLLPSDKIKGSKLGGGGGWIHTFCLLFVGWIAPILILIGLHPRCLFPRVRTLSHPETYRERDSDRRGRERKRARVREESACGARFPHCVSDRAMVRECMRERERERGGGGRGKWGDSEWMGDEKPCEPQRKCECAQRGDTETQKVSETISPTKRWPVATQKTEWRRLKTDSHPSTGKGDSTQGPEHPSPAAAQRSTVSSRACFCLPTSILHSPTVFP